MKSLRFVTKFFYFFECGYQVVQYHLLERLSFLHLFTLLFCQRPVYSICLSIWVLFLSHWSICPFLHQYHTVIIAVTLDMSWSQVVSPLTFVLLLQCCVDCWIIVTRAANKNTRLGGLEYRYLLSCGSGGQESKVKCQPLGLLWDRLPWLANGHHFAATSASLICEGTAWVSLQMPRISSYKDTSQIGLGQLLKISFSLTYLMVLIRNLDTVRDTKDMCTQRQECEDVANRWPYVSYRE